MSTIRVHGACLAGVGAELVTVEARFEAAERERSEIVLTGLPDPVLRESRGRLTAALDEAGLSLPTGTLHLHLVPAGRRKSGEALDLALALGAAAACGHLDPRWFEGTLFVGELGLDGRLHPVAGGLAAAEIARRAGLARVCAPEATAIEASFETSIAAHAFGSLTEVLGAISGASPWPPRVRVARSVAAPARAGDRSSAGDRSNTGDPSGTGDRADSGDRGDSGDRAGAGDRASDRGSAAACGGASARGGDAALDRASARGLDAARGLDQVRGHASGKRALAAAAAGGHGLLYIGPPGTGKSLLARCLPELLAPPDEQEALEITRVLSAIGRWPGGLARERPFRAPHHTVSYAGLVGGGIPVAPGEVTLAHCGVLFLDELPEFRREALEALRQPLETGRVLVSRSGTWLELPARFQVVAAMNPCPCGYLGHPRIPCRCSPTAIQRYRGRISGPLLDRIPLRVELPAPALEELVPEAAPTAHASATSGGAATAVDPRSLPTSVPASVPISLPESAPGSAPGSALVSAPVSESALAPAMAPAMAPATAPAWMPAMGTSAGAGTSASALAARVRAARERMVERQGALRNVDLEADALDRWAPLEPPARRLLEAVCAKYGLSARAIQGLRRVARTLADLEAAERVEVRHCAEALALRAPIWN
jgi:magnesium chelatase family protein